MDIKEADEQLVSDWHSDRDEPEPSPQDSGQRKRFLRLVRPRQCADITQE